MGHSVLVALVVAMCFASHSTDASPDTKALTKQVHDQMNVRLLRGNGDVDEERGGGPAPPVVEVAKTDFANVVFEVMSGMKKSEKTMSADVASTSQQIGHLHETNRQAGPHENPLPPRPDSVEQPALPPRSENVESPVSPPNEGSPRDVTPPAAPQEGGFPKPVKPEGAKPSNAADEHPPAAHPEDVTPGSPGTKTKNVGESVKEGETAEDVKTKAIMKEALAKLSPEEQAALYKAGVTPETLEATAKYAGNLVKLASNQKEPSRLMKVLKGLYYLSGAGAILTIIILAFMFHNISTKAPTSTAPAPKTTAGGA